MNEINVCFAGDCSLANIDSLVFSDQLIELFSKKDLVLGNLESVITNSGIKRKLHPYHLKASQADLHLLDHFDAFTIANNHVLDYGFQGLSDTVSTLKEKGIGYFGAGCNRKEAEKPFIRTINGIKLAFFGASRWANINIFRNHGSASISSSRILSKIRELSLEGYFIILMVHWGYEHISLPSPSDRHMAKKLFSKGVDLIIGSHSHQFQSIESIGGKLVFYSLGNFIFSSKDFKNKKNDELFRSSLVSINIKADKSYTYSLLPYLLSENEIILQDERNSKIYKNYIKEISSKTDLSDKVYRKLFYQSIIEFKNRDEKLSRKNISKRSKEELTTKARRYIIKAKYFKLQDLKILLYRIFVNRYSKKNSG